MQHGKDYMSDKPGITTLEQLAEVRKVQAETKRIYSIMYSERFENRATVKAGELVKAGAIGQVIQTIGLGPASHHAGDAAGVVLRQGRSTAASSATSARTRPISSCTSPARRGPRSSSSQVGNVHIPISPRFEDFGDVMLRGDRGTGYIRVDWFTPDGLATWGDGRLTILGTDGFIEIRKNVDIGGRPGASHLFLVDQKETRYIDCKDVALPYGDAARGRRPQPHRDRDAAGALLPRHRADAEGAGAGADASRSALVTSTVGEAAGRSVGGRAIGRARETSVAWRRRSAGVAASVPHGGRTGHRGVRRRSPGFPSIVPASVLGANSPGQPHQHRRDRQRADLARARSARDLEVRQPRGSWRCAISTASASRTRGR